MRFDSIAFIGFCGIAIFVLRLLRPGVLKSIALLAFNLVFVSTFCRNLAQLLPLFGFILLGYVAILAVARRFPPWIAVLLLVSCFVWLKQYNLIVPLPVPVLAAVTVGLSYILFRVLHLVIDVAEGALALPGPIAYLNYVFFFLVFVSGPIQRFEEFAAQAGAPARSLEPVEVNAIAGRIVRGYFLVVIISTAAFDLQAAGLPHLYHVLQAGFGFDTLRFYSFCALTYLIYLYANFAGYMDIVIGVGLLAGFHLPENFNQPLASANFLEFWSRWHITLSNWFKFYLFNPLLKFGMARWGRAASPLTLGAVAFFITFFVMGMWHGTTLTYIVYGVTLGFGIALNYVWQNWMGKVFGKKRYKKIAGGRWYYQLSRAATVSYFCIAITCIWIAPAQASALVRPAGLLLIAATFVVLTLLGMVMGFAWDAAGRWVESRLIGGGIGRLFLALVLTCTCSALLDSLLLSASGAFAINSFVRLGVGIAGFAFFATAGAVCAGIFEPFLQRLSERFSCGQWMVLCGWTALRLVILANFATVMAGNVPGFVYKAF